MRARYRPPDRSLKGHRGRVITFFAGDSSESEALEPIRAEAEARGYRTRTSINLEAAADVGFYCAGHTELRSINALTSIISLHDIGQLHTKWPRFWATARWHRFDLGLLPGESWRAMAEHAEPDLRINMPRNGLHVVGWPKADKAASINRSAMPDPIPDRGDMPVFLHAPSWENGGKVVDFLRACAAVNAVAAIKFPRIDQFGGWGARQDHLIDEIRRAMSWINEGLRSRVDEDIAWSRVRLLDPSTPIMEILPFVDVVVSDESSVLFEGLLFGAWPLVVEDWWRPIGFGRHANPGFPHLEATTRDQLAASLVSFTTDRPDALDLRDYWFSNIGSAAACAMDVYSSAVFPRTLSLARRSENPRELAGLEIFKRERHRTAINLARAAHEERDWETARSLWADLLNTASSDRAALSGYARASLNSGRLDEAARAFKELSRRFPDFEAGPRGLAQVSELRAQRNG